MLVSAFAEIKYYRPIALCMLEQLGMQAKIKVFTCFVLNLYLLKNVRWSNIFFYWV
jgi:hypothetical protein